MLLVSQLLLWVAVILLAVALLAVARQVGVLHERVAPVGALVIGEGPQRGDPAPQIVGTTLSGTRLTVGGERPGQGMQLLFFVAPTCPICKELLPTAKRFAESEALELVLIGDGDAGQHRRMADKHGIAHDRFINGPDIGRAFHVGKLPFAALLSEGGRVLALGLVNSREHLESLVNAHESGFRSVQDYLRAQGPGPGGDTASQDREMHSHV